MKCDQVSSLPAMWIKWGGESGGARIAMRFGSKMNSSCHQQRARSVGVGDEGVCCGGCKLVKNPTATLGPSAIELRWTPPADGAMLHRCSPSLRAVSERFQSGPQLHRSSGIRVGFQASLNTLLSVRFGLIRLTDDLIRMESKIESS